MDKEKQAFDFVQKGYELCWKIEELEGSELQTEIITMAEEYTNRAVKDIAALKAEKVGALNAANYWKQNYDTLKAEAEEKQHAIDHMGFDIEQLLAEIERKNEALKECKGCAKEFKTGDVGTALLARRIYDVSEQALQTKEE